MRHTKEDYLNTTFATFESLFNYKESVRTRFYSSLFALSLLFPPFSPLSVQRQISHLQGSASSCRLQNSFGESSWDFYVSNRRTSSIFCFPYCWLVPRTFFVFVPSYTLVLSLLSLCFYPLSPLFYVTTHSFLLFCKVVAIVTSKVSE